MTVDTALAISLSVEAPLLLFNATILICIVRQRWKGNASFSTDFFVIYMLQSLADLYHYPMVMAAGIQGRT